VRPKGVVVLGSTGSIGINTLKVMERWPDRFNVVGLSAHTNVVLLEKQIIKFRPKMVAVGPPGVEHLRRRGFEKIVRILSTADVVQMITLSAVDLVVLAIGGAVALDPFLTAVRNGKIVAPANKEALVMAGHILMAEAKKYGATIVPIDSEQSAIFQCLQGRNQAELKRIYLTASGGPLHRVALKQFRNLTVRDILKHPRWKMGKKITVDSATLMNKGLEVMEAKWLFDVAIEKIKVLIHPQAIIHSMVEFCDGSIIAQLGVTDMRLPIQYALTYPERLNSPLPPLDFFKLGTLNFEKPDLKKFPALALAYEVATRGGSFPCVLNAANEEAVAAFLKGQFNFHGIFKIVEKVVRQHKNITRPTLKEIYSTENWAREEARRYL